MKRHLSAILATVVLSLAFCSSAMGAVSLSFTEAEHQEATINRGDELVTYAVKVKNTGTTTTSGTTNVSLALLGGAKLGTGLGSGWSCHVSAQTCSSTNTVEGGAEFPQLTLQVWLYPELAPDNFTATFTAFGGGAATDAVATDSFTFGPRVPFEIIDLAAGACSEPPAPPGPGICSSVLGAADYTQAGGHPYAATSTLGLTTHTTAQKGNAELTPVEHLRDLYSMFSAEDIPGIRKVEELEVE